MQRGGQGLCAPLCAPQGSDGLGSPCPCRAPTPTPCRWHWELMGTQSSSGGSAFPICCVPVGLVGLPSRWGHNWRGHMCVPTGPCRAISGFGAEVCIGVSSLGVAEAILHPTRGRGGGQAAWVCGPSAGTPRMSCTAPTSSPPGWGQPHPRFQQPGPLSQTGQPGDAVVGLAVPLSGYVRIHQGEPR